VMQPPLFFQQKCTAPCNRNHNHLRDSKFKQSGHHCVPSKTEKRKTRCQRHQLILPIQHSWYTK
jgi:hypothetical protein